MFSISGKKEKKNSKLKIEIKFFRSGLFFTVGRERGNKSNFIFGLMYWRDNRKVVHSKKEKLKRPVHITKRTTTTDVKMSSGRP